MGGDVIILYTLSCTTLNTSSPRARGDTLTLEGNVMKYFNASTLLSSTHIKSALHGALALAACSMLLGGCASSKTTATSDTDTDKEPMEQTSVVSKDHNTSIAEIRDELRAEYERFNIDLEDELDPETNTVIVRENYPVAAIYFDFDVARLDEANMIGVERAYTWLEAHPDNGLVITGHADKQGSIPYNQELGMKRAQAAGDALMKKGIPPHRLVIVTHGEEHKIYSKDEYNRRVVFMTDPANAYGVNKSEPGVEKTIRVVAANQ